MLTQSVVNSRQWQVGPTPPTKSLHSLAAQSRTPSGCSRTKVSSLSSRSEEPTSGRRWRCSLSSARWAVMSRASAAKRQEPATRSEVGRVDCVCGHWSGQHLAAFTSSTSPCIACACDALMCGECGEQDVPDVVVHGRQCAKGVTSNKPQVQK